MSDEDPVELGVELLAHLEHGELSVAAAVDRIETITTDPTLQREILDTADRRGVIERGDGIIRPQRGTFLQFESDESRQGFPAAEHGYLKTLTSVADCANDRLVDRVAEDIKEHIRTHEERPTNRSIRQDARMLLAEEEIVADTYLN